MVLITFCWAENESRTLRLNSGYDCPLVGIGTGGFRTGGPPQGKVAIQLIHDAIDSGYRHIDTASAYGNEKAIGQAVTEVLAKGVLKRQELFITTKLMPNPTNTRDETLKSVQLSIQNLNTSYVDLMLIHMPSDDLAVNDKVWSALEEAVAQKLIRSIGVSNFNAQQIDSLLKNAKVVPAMLQVESHPQVNQRQLISYSDKHGIHLTAYSPLGAGTLIKNPTIVSIGKSHNKSAATVMIRWQVQRGVAAIPKSLKLNYIKENIDVFDWTLTDNEMKTFRLNNGVDCPVIGLGTGGFDGAPQGELVKQMVRDAIDVGYRLIDTAAYYGNEEAIGDAVNEVITNGKVRREELFISTKVFLLIGQSIPISRAETVENVRIGIQKLNQTYVDMILFHFPSESDEINREVWSGLEDALNQGLVRAIGVSNFNVQQLESLIQTANVLPAMNQIESHPQLSQRQLLDYCSRYKIRVTAYSPLGAGTLISNSKLISIGNKYNKTSAQVMIRWQIQRGVVAIPKSTKADRLRDNFNVFDFSLTDEEMNIIENM
ncbi:unnamed protein product [Medioppia subpectinata]|uniref:NADP-dependent oxidoreductase domain-containing protein n=1 Tax=Medioppia subpectinata TaxID=1979941 RepID=A0A7R9KZA6_9ACAR|nr:unnamed protein product [Medioppia subpectinata]CAG2112657.1 unnamed protein product [Medioppia subpectinata]